jgi:hypothetical protein
MAIGSQYLEVFSEIALDSGRLGRRFYDQQLDDFLPLPGFNSVYINSG